MKRILIILMGLVVAATITACSSLSGQTGWISLIDGNKGLENFDRLGDANWRAQGNAVVADQAKVDSFLVSKNSCRDFQIRAEFWTETTTNSGIFIRLSDPKNVTAANSYEVNIYDQRPDPLYGTGAIVDFAKVSPMPKAGGRWNTYLVTAKGGNILVELNGVQTVNLQDSKFASGSIALQFANDPKDAPGGAIKWRSVQIRPL